MISLNCGRTCGKNHIIVKAYLKEFKNSKKKFTQLRNNEGNISSCSFNSNHI